MVFSQKNEAALQANQNAQSQKNNDLELHQKYHYILNENTILKKDKHDLEIEVSGK